MSPRYQPLRFAQKIGEAIRLRHLLCLRYDGESRVVAPYLYGRSVKGNMVLSGFQLQNQSDPNARSAWRAFDEQRITALEILKQSFKPRQDYNPNDRHFNLKVFAVIRRPQADARGPR